MKYKFKIVGIDCPNCAAKLAAIIEKKERVLSAKINFLTEKVTLECDMSEAEALETVEALAKAFDKGIKVEK